MEQKERPAKTMPANYISIVVGAGNKNVYFYNGSGVTGQMSLKDFLGK
jgi:hypothetical protein